MFADGLAKKHPRRSVTLRVPQRDLTVREVPPSCPAAPSSGGPNHRSYSLRIVSSTLTAVRSEPIGVSLASRTESENTVAPKLSFVRVVEGHLRPEIDDFRATEDLEPLGEKLEGSI